MSIYRADDIPEDLREYFEPAEIGLESTPDEYVARLVEVFQEVRRVLRSDGVFFLNIGDSYATGGNGGNATSKTFHGHSKRVGDRLPKNKPPPGLKHKDRCMIPARVAVALQADGWWLRSEIIWHKPNTMPSSVTDRPTDAHEMVYLLTKSAKYFWDQDAVREPHESSYSKDAIKKNEGEIGGERPDGNNFNKQERHTKGGKTPRTRADRAKLLNPEGRNIRTVWKIPTQPYKKAHFATFPQKLVEPMIKAGSREPSFDEEMDETVRDTILDPFSGAGTTGVVACKLGRDYIGIEINPEYAEMQRDRIEQDQPLFNSVAVQTLQK